MSASLTLECDMEDKNVLSKAVKESVKELFPGLSREQIDQVVNMAEQDKKIPLRKTDERNQQVDIRIDAGSMGIHTVVVLKDGRRLGFKSKEQAQSYIQEKNMKDFVDSIHDRAWIYADMGYSKKKSGKFSKVVSDVDQGAGAYSGNPTNGLFGPEFDNKVQAIYSGIKTIQHLSKKGVKINTKTFDSAEKTPDGKIIVEAEIPDTQIAAISEAMRLQYQPR